MIPPNPDSPTIVDAPAPEKKPRRRLTPEQRIAEREAEIERIREQRRERVREMIYEAKETLACAQKAAAMAGMVAEADQCQKAIEAL